MMIGLAGVAAAAIVGQGASIDLKSLSWMTGSWSAKAEAGVYEESWSDPASNNMSGFGRYVAAGVAQSTQYYSIEKTQKGITMFVVVGNGQKGLQIKQFHLVSAGQKTSTWECEENPFPRTLKYTKLQDGTLQCVRLGVQKRPADGRELTPEEARAQRKEVLTFKAKG